MTSKDLAEKSLNVAENKSNEDKAFLSVSQQEQEARSLTAETLEHTYTLESDRNHSEGNNEPWGQHLVLDLGGCNENILTKEGIAKFVKELVQAIEMVAYGEPQIVHFAEHSYEAAGYSLVQLIETSAIMGHFSDNNRDAYLDIFSCKKFSNQTAIDVVRKHFNPSKVKSISLDRGIHLTRSNLQAQVREF